MEVWTGFIVGLVGSIHCIGMCGPIAIALPITGKSKLDLILSRIFYNLGRVVTYSFMGALFGLFGSRLMLFGLQQNLSIILGILIIIFILMPKKFKMKINNLKFVNRLLIILKSQFSILNSANSNLSLFIVGLFNGLLPCGFVYVGIAGATSTGNWLLGASYMALFGLGTFPIMFAASIMGKVVGSTIKRRLNKLVPIFAFLLALIFIIRGLNLGIPYLSPKLANQPAGTVKPECCN
jgi:uncharacterized protein